MSFAKIALFAFGLATLVTAGAVNANAASQFGNSYGWSNSGQFATESNDVARYDHAKGFVQGY